MMSNSAAAQSGQEGLTRTRRRASLSDEQWEKHRPFLLHLYAEQNFQLKAVKHIMCTAFAFNATEQMYKKRFAKWGIRKNMSIKEKEQLGVALLTARHGNLPAPVVALLSEPSFRRRIRRYIRDKGVVDSIPKADEDETAQNEEPEKDFAWTNPPEDSQVSIQQYPSNHIDKVATVIHAQQLQYLALKQHPQTQVVEEILLHARQYYDFVLARHHLDNSLQDRRHTDAVFIRIQCARRLLAGGDYARAFLMLHLACNDAKTMFTEHPFNLLLEFLRAFLKPGWAKFPEARSQVMGHLLSMSRLLLGPNHALTKLTELLAITESLTEAGPRFLRLLGDMVSEYVRDEEQALHMRLILVECYIAFDRFEEAEAICSTYVSGNNATLSTSTSVELGQKALRYIGCIRYKQGQRDLARMIWLQVYHQDVNRLGGPIAGSDAVVNCTHLASLYEGQGDFPRSTFFYRQAFEGALRTWDGKIVDLFEYYNSLEYVLTKSEKLQELKSFRARYGGLMTSWDQAQMNGLCWVKEMPNSLLRQGQVTERRRCCDFDAGLHRHFVC